MSIPNGAWTVITDHPGLCHGKVIIKVKKKKKGGEGSVQFSSVAQSCPTLYDPMNCSMPSLPVHHQVPEFTQTQVHRVSDAIQPSHPLLLLPLIPPSIRVFSNESTLCMRWPKYWSFRRDLLARWSLLVEY